MRPLCVMILERMGHTLGNTLPMLHSQRLTPHRATQGGVSLMTTPCGQLNEIPRGIHLQLPLRRAP